MVHHNNIEMCIDDGVMLTQLLRITYINKVMPVKARGSIIMTHCAYIITVEATIHFKKCLYLQVFRQLVPLPCCQFQVPYRQTTHALCFTLYTALMHI